jgi:plasmid stabilization system protein ParE
MGSRALIRPKAEANLYAAASWYQDQEPGSSLWLELLGEFDVVVSQLCAYPESAPVYEGRIRRALLRRFPYALYYLIEDEQIVVITFLAMKLEQGSGTR